MRSALLAEILRNGVVESRHTGAFAVADARGHVVLSAGDPTRAIYPRSAIKGLQALPLVASGAAARFTLVGAELALACASHCGAAIHVETARAMLARAGQDAACLECGTHWPTAPTDALALAANGQRPSALHNNCSGKHAGFICTAIAAGRDPGGYIAPDHPVMRDVTAAVSAVTGERLQDQAPGIDGCSIPTFLMPLDALARGFARFGTGQGMPEDFGAAASALRRAVAANPVMLAGAGRFDTVVTEALREKAFIKVGAEGVYGGSLPELGLGFAVKIDDGAPRAAEAVTAALLRHFLGPDETLNRLAAPVLTNWNGIEVGVVRARLV